MPEARRDVAVARIPRDIGTSVGVNDTVVGVPAARERFCSISGICRCAPATAYGVAAPMTSLANRCVLSDLPAPEVPLASTVTMSVGSITLAASPGANARLTAVALHPGTEIGR